MLFVKADNDMKQRLFRVILITTTLLAAAVFLRPLKVFAASGKVSFKADKEEVEVKLNGDE